MKYLKTAQCYLLIIYCTRARFWQQGSCKNAFILASWGGKPVPKEREGRKGQIRALFFTFLISSTVLWLTVLTDLTAVKAVA